MSCSYKSLPVHGGSSPRTQHRKAGLCPQKLPTDENREVAKVLGAQLQDDFQSQSSFRTLGPVEEQQHFIILGKDLSSLFRSHDFSFDFVLHLLPHLT